MTNEKTIAMKVLEGKNIPYEAFSYPDTLRNAEEVAQAVGFPADHVFKTLVVPRPKPAKPMLVMIPADSQLDLKKLAKGVKEKKLKLAAHSQAEQLTGLQVGGISPLALLNRGFAIFLDKSAEGKDWIVISAGKRGLQVKLSVDSLVGVTQARMIDAAGA